MSRKKLEGALLAVALLLASAELCTQTCERAVAFLIEKAALGTKPSASN